MQRHDLPVSRRGDLTDEQWERIYPYLPVGRKGRPFNNVRDTVNGILRILQTGSPWRDLPPVYGNWNTIYKCFARWEQTGVSESIFKILSEDAHMQDVSIDSSCCKAHRHSAGAEKGGLIHSPANISE